MTFQNQSLKPYLDSWWKEKKDQGYCTQAKHLSVLGTLMPEDFPLVDLGTGDGTFLSLVEEAFPGQHCEGVEVSSEAIRGKKCSSRIFHSDLFHWRDSERKFSTVTLIDVIEHLPNPEALFMQLAETATHLILACPNFSFLLARLDMLIGKIPFQNREARGGHIYWCQYSSLRRLFSQTGFEVAQEMHLFPRNNNRLLRAIFQMRPSLFAHEFVFRLRRMK